MKLLPKDELVRTSRVDHADWNYSPVLAYVMRRRFALIRKLLPRKRVRRLLEIGFGSGVFLPELSEHCDELYGIDVHEHLDEVQSALERRGIPVTLTEEDAASVNFRDAFFDTIVCVSALEFISDIDAAADEAARILKPDGLLVAVMPATSRILDLALFALTGESARDDYGNRRERVLPAMLRHFEIARSAAFAGIYRAYAFRLKAPTAV